MKYKSTIRIPTSDPYAYLEIDYEGEPDEVVEVYREFTNLINPKDTEGLLDKEWNALTDKYLTTNTMKAEEYESLSREQKEKVQWIKRAFKRIKYKNENK